MDEENIELPAGEVLSLGDYVKRRASEAGLVPVAVNIINKNGDVERIVVESVEYETKHKNRRIFFPYHGIGGAREITSTEQ